MKKLFFLAAVIVCFVPLRSQNAPGDMSHPGGHIMLNVSDLKWVDAPPGLPSGAQIAVLSGDPSKPGPFTLRAKFPQNYKVPPHWHSTYENVAVLEGTLSMGSGDLIDESKAMTLQPGGYAAIPAKSHHYVFTKEKCVLQINGEGPFEINYINPADDPRTKK